MTGSEMVMKMLNNINTADTEQKEETNMANISKKNKIKKSLSVRFDEEKNEFVSKKDAFNFLIETIRENPVGNYQEATLKFLEHEVDLLNRKAERTSAKKEENPVNKKIAELVVEVLTDVDKEMTLSEIIEDARLATFIDEKGVEKKMTVQKMSFCIGMVDDKVSKRKVKGKMVYKLA